MNNLMYVGTAAALLGTQASQAPQFQIQEINTNDNKIDASPDITYYTGEEGRNYIANITSEKVYVNTGSEPTQQSSFNFRPEYKIENNQVIINLPTTDGSTLGLGPSNRTEILGAIGLPWDICIKDGKFLPIILRCKNGDVPVKMTEKGTFQYYTLDERVGGFCSSYSSQALVYNAETDERSTEVYPENESRIRYPASPNITKYIHGKVLKFGDDASGFGAYPNSFDISTNIAQISENPEIDNTAVKYFEQTGALDPFRLDIFESMEGNDDYSYELNDLVHKITYTNPNILAPTVAGQPATVEYFGDALILRSFDGKSYTIVCSLPTNEDYSKGLQQRIEGSEGKVVSEALEQKVQTEETITPSTVVELIKANCKSTTFNTAGGQVSENDISYILHRLATGEAKNFSRHIKITTQNGQTTVTIFGKQMGIFKKASTELNKENEKGEAFDKAVKDCILEQEEIKKVQKLYDALPESQKTTARATALADLWLKLANLQEDQAKKIDSLQKVVTNQIIANETNRENSTTVAKNIKGCMSLYNLNDASLTIKVTQIEKDGKEYDETMEFFKNNEPNDQNYQEFIQKYNSLKPAEITDTITIKYKQAKRYEAINSISTNLNGLGAKIDLTKDPFENIKAATQILDSLQTGRGKAYAQELETKNPTVFQKAREVYQKIGDLYYRGPAGSTLERTNITTIISNKNKVEQAGGNTSYLSADIQENIQTAEGLRKKINQDYKPLADDILNGTDIYTIITQWETYDDDTKANLEAFAGVSKKINDIEEELKLENKDIKDHCQDYFDYDLPGLTRYRTSLHPYRKKNQEVQDTISKIAEQIQTNLNTKKKEILQRNWEIKDLNDTTRIEPRIKEIKDYYPALLIDSEINTEISNYNTKKEGLLQDEIQAALDKLSKEEKIQALHLQVDSLITTKDNFPLSLSSHLSTINKTITDQGITDQNLIKKVKELETACKNAQERREKLEKWTVTMENYAEFLKLYYEQSYEELQTPNAQITANYNKAINLQAFIQGCGRIIDQYTKAVQQAMKDTIAIDQTIKELGKILSDTTKVGPGAGAEVRKELELDPIIIKMQDLIKRYQTDEDAQYLKDVNKKFKEGKITTREQLEETAQKINNIPKRIKLAQDISSLLNIRNYNQGILTENLNTQNIESRIMAYGGICTSDRTQNRDTIKAFTDFIANNKTPLSEDAETMRSWIKATCDKYNAIIKDLTEWDSKNNPEKQKDMEEKRKDLSSIEQQKNPNLREKIKTALEESKKEAKKEIWMRDIEELPKGADLMEETIKKVESAQTTSEIDQIINKGKEALNTLISERIKGIQKDIIASFADGTFSKVKQEAENPDRIDTASYEGARQDITGRYTNAKIEINELGQLVIIIKIGDKECAFYFEKDIYVEEPNNEDQSQNQNGDGIETAISEMKDTDDNYCIMDDKILIDCGEKETQYQIMLITGQGLKDGKTRGEIDITKLKPGILILTYGNRSVKFIKR